MNLTKVEKITFAILTTILIVGLMLLLVKVGNNRINNGVLLRNIDSVARFTDRTRIEKTYYFNETESRNKLNLNRTDLVSIKNIPCLSAPLAKRIFEFISEKGQISDLTELLEVKGMNRKKLRQLDLYATVFGGHAGSAAWGDKVNLNFTNEEELATLPGVSKSIAEKIINFRNSNGGFHSVDDLYQIPGLSEKNISNFIHRVEVK